MPRLHRALALLVAAAFVAGGCASDPEATESPGVSVGPTPTPTPEVTEVPFTVAAWPVSGSACATEGYRGRLGQLRALDARTVEFTLCRPDGAFAARLAHPALSVLDSTSIDRLADDATAGRSLAGTGAYRLARWTEGENVLLERVGAASPVAVTPTVILAWEAGAARRTDRLEEASVDGIDDPGAAELERIVTQPELVVTPRPGLATAYLAFGAGRAFASTRVRRAVTLALDRDAITRAGFPEGSVVPTHLVPCGIVGACEGRAWYEYNAPAGAAALAEESFDLDAVYPLRIPDRPVPGLPDPLAAAEAVRAQLDSSIGMTVRVDAMPLESFREAVARAELDGLYLDGVASSLADPSAFLEPLFGAGVRTSPARRADGVTAILREAAGTADPAARADAFARASDTVRSGAVIVPLAHPGAVVTYRSDVAGVAVSPLGLDPLGAATPGDRPQLVFLQATEPGDAYCPDEATQDAYRLCGMLFEGLYGFAPGALAPEPALAERCTPDAEVRVWTCTLRADVAYSDGAVLDAGDVLASFVAQWDRGEPLRAGDPDAAFTAWDELFGGTLGDEGP